MKLYVILFAIASIECTLTAQNLPERSGPVMATHSIEEIRSAIPTIVDPIERRQAQLRLAQLVYQRASLSPSDRREAIQNLKEALGEKKNFSLEMLSARVQLASLLIITGKSAEAKDLLEEVIGVTPEKIYHDEFSPEYLKAISVIDPRFQKAGITADSPLQKEAVERRLKVGKRNVMERYQNIRDAAVRQLSNEVYRESGSKGLKELNAKYSDRPEVRKVISEVIADKLSDSDR